MHEPINDKKIFAVEACYLPKQSSYEHCRQ
jgi:hypothetical protein